jgi:alpha-tubulin suppressor-like RCC1 family protein
MAVRSLHFFHWCASTALIFVAGIRSIWLTIFVFALTSGPAFAAATVTQVWGGARSCIALKSDGTVWDWGANYAGKLGIGDATTPEANNPVQVHGPGGVGFLSSIIAVMGGEIHNTALKSDGTVWSWGGNALAGQIGDGTTTDRYAPVQVIGLTGVSSLGGRGYHTLALKQDGTVWTWGNNRGGQLGVATNFGTDVPNPTPVQVGGLVGTVTAVSGGGFYSIALMSDGTVQTWGLNNTGQLGDGTTTAKYTPATVSGISNVKQISAGWQHAVVLKQDGTVWTWGRNPTGELGNNTTTNSSTPVQVLGPNGVGFLTNIIAVSGGDCHTAALKSDGTVWTWGCNDLFLQPGNVQFALGQLGDGTYTERHTPVQVVGLTNIVQVAARDYHNIAIKSDGTVWTWGWNINGQYGNGTTVTGNVPVQVVWPPERILSPSILMLLLD